MNESGESTSGIERLDSEDDTLWAYKVAYERQYPTGNIVTKFRYFVANDADVAVQMCKQQCDVHRISGVETDSSRAMTSVGRSVSDSI